MNRRVVRGTDQEEVVFRIVLRFGVGINMMNLKRPAAVSVTTIAARAPGFRGHCGNHFLGNRRPVNPRFDLVDLFACVVPQELLATMCPKFRHGVSSVANLFYQIARQAITEQRVSSFSFAQRIAPMIQASSIGKIIQLGVPLYKNKVSGFSLQSFF